MKHLGALSGVSSLNSLVVFSYLNIPGGSLLFFRQPDCIFYRTGETEVVRLPGMKSHPFIYFPSSLASVSFRGHLNAGMYECIREGMCFQA